MAQTSSIEWTDSTWNPVTGCHKVSPGCAHCYAETLTERFAGRKGYIEEHRPWTPENAEHNVRLHPERLEQPLRWKRPRMVFVNSMSDMFHELVPIDFTREIFRVMHQAKQHVFQILTKRPEHALKVMQEVLYRGDNPFNGSEVYWDPSPNVWIGVSIENARYTWRADVLREIPAAVRFISAEPLLGSLLEPAPVTVLGEAPFARLPGDDSRRRAPLDLTGIDWLIVGGESGGRDARPMHPEWARELRDAVLDREKVLDDGLGPDMVYQERPAFFFKQWGSWAPERPKHVKDRGVASAHPDGTVTTVHGPDPTRFFESTAVYYHGASPKSGGRLLDGREWNEMPCQPALTRS